MSNGLTKHFAIRLSSRAARKIGVLNDEELKIKSDLERAKNFLFTDKYSQAVRLVSREIDAYEGDLKDFFMDYLDGLRYDRRVRGSYSCRELG